MHFSRPEQSSFELQTRGVCSEGTQIAPAPVANAGATILAVSRQTSMGDAD
jgi:hypothetical protein